MNIYASFSAMHLCTLDMSSEINLIKILVRASTMIWWVIEYIYKRLYAAGILSLMRLSYLNLVVPFRNITNRHIGDDSERNRDW